MRKCSRSVSDLSEGGRGALSQRGNGEARRREAREQPAHEERSRGLERTLIILNSARLRAGGTAARGNGVRGARQPSTCVAPGTHTGASVRHLQTLPPRYPTPAATPLHPHPPREKGKAQLHGRSERTRALQRRRTCVVPTLLSARCCKWQSSISDDVPVKFDVSLLRPGGGTSVRYSP
ncbi:hypothetical protein GN956_G16725 [Arapaima gigas]